jgi:hypothetical protein
MTVALGCPGGGEEEDCEEEERRRERDGRHGRGQWVCVWCGSE